MKNPLLIVDGKPMFNMDISRVNRNYTDEELSKRAGIVAEDIVSIEIFRPISGFVGRWGEKASGGIVSISTRETK